MFIRDIARTKIGTKVTDLQLRGPIDVAGKRGKLEKLPIFKRPLNSSTALELAA